MKKGNQIKSQTKSGSERAHELARMQPQPQTPADAPSLISGMRPKEGALGELVRPVKCHFCKEQMHYVDDPRFEPEVRVVAIDNSISDAPHHKFFAHTRCWDAKMKS